MLYYLLIADMDFTHNNWYNVPFILTICWPKLFVTIFSQPIIPGYGFKHVTCTSVIVWIMCWVPQYGCWSIHTTTAIRFSNKYTEIRLFLCFMQFNVKLSYLALVGLTIPHILFPFHCKYNSRNCCAFAAVLATLPTGLLETLEDT